MSCACVLHGIYVESVDTAHTSHKRHTICTTCWRLRGMKETSLFVMGRIITGSSMITVPARLPVAFYDKSYHESNVSYFMFVSKFCIEASHS